MRIKSNGIKSISTKLSSMKFFGAHHLEPEFHLSTSLCTKFQIVHCYFSYIAYFPSMNLPMNSFMIAEYDLVKSECIVEALRTVDRRFFVPKSSQDHAYFDHPMKEGNIHISAPHMYCTVAENLELVPNSNLSFLNIGSGTGYFSCLVGQILGPKSTSFAVELHADVIEHAKRAVQGWKIERAHDIVTPEIKFFHGNGFNIKLQGESRLGYDRIYVGGSIDRFQLPLIENLLAPGGILVAPVEDSLVKVRRSRIEGTHHEIITSVYYAKLAENPKLEVLIPSTVWDPALHYTFPSDFHESIWALLLCANSPSPRVNSAASIPKDIWLYIFRYMNKNCECHLFVVSYLNETASNQLIERVQTRR